MRKIPENRVPSLRYLASTLHGGGGQIIKTKKAQGLSQVGGDKGGNLNATWSHGLNSRTEKDCDCMVREI